MDSVKVDQVPAHSLFQGDFENPLDELLLLVSYVGRRTSYNQEKVDGIRSVKIK